ncbi:MAG: NUDIX hydrolase [Lachnospiraceae bacterium]|jgi:hypothetical protein|nr:NUDIX hydrolase [Lachnospiraceae bacterium]
MSKVTISRNGKAILTLNANTADIGQYIITDEAGNEVDITNDFPDVTRLLPDTRMRMAFSGEQDFQLEAGGSALVIFYRDPTTGKIMLIMQWRSGDKAFGYPGGGWNANETALMCAERETREESRTINGKKFVITDFSVVRPFAYFFGAGMHRTAPNGNKLLHGNMPLLIPIEATSFTPDDFVGMKSEEAEGDQQLEYQALCLDDLYKMAIETPERIFIPARPSIKFMYLNQAYIKNLWAVPIVLKDEGGNYLI